MALLHALVTLRPRLPAEIRALHVDHGLHADSDRWAKSCTEICSRWSVPLRIELVQVRKNGGHGVEADARRARYAAAASLIKPNDVLLTGHHADDQAETVLLNLMRGSGVDGLAGMPVTRPLGEGLLARPLLPYPGATLRNYLTRQELEWIEDTSNQDESYDRNFIRHALVPILEQRWPGSWHNLSQSARHCREASDFIAATCQEMLEACLHNDAILDLSCLKVREKKPGGDLAMKQVIRHWLRSRQAASLPRERLQELLRQLDQAQRESHITVRWDGWVLHHYQNRLWLEREDDIEHCPSVSWDPADPIDLGRTLGTLRLEGPGAPPRWRLSIEPRRGGERIASLADGGHRSVKQVLQEAQVPPWLRSSVPILWLGGQVVAVGTLAMDLAFRHELEQERLTLAWNPRSQTLKSVFTRDR